MEKTTKAKYVTAIHGHGTSSSWDIKVPFPKANNGAIKINKTKNVSTEVACLCSIS
jgi:hypothetical protein